MTPGELFTAAETARLDCVNFVMSERCPTSMRFHRAQSLKFMCATASLYLGRQLASRGLEVQIVQGIFGHQYRDVINHTWVRVGLKIADITATQFSSRGGHYPSVFIAPWNHHAYDPKKESEPFDTTAFRDWPENQRPDEKLLSLIKENLP